MPDLQVRCADGGAGELVNRGAGVALLAKLEAAKAMDKDAEAELSAAVAAFKKSFA